MKKTLVAIAALAAFGAQAQSTVSITGVLDLGAQHIDYKGNGITNAGAANGSTTSNIVIGGTEDIGGGLSANFRWEIDPDLANTVGKTAGTSATGTTSNVSGFLSNGYSFLGLKSAQLGTVEFGTLNYATLSANGDGNGGFGTAIGSGYRVTSFDAVRGQNGASYETPAFMGVTAKAVVISKNALQSASPALGSGVNQQYGRDSSQELSLAYANGPLTVRYADLQMNQYASTAWGGTNPTAATYVRGNGAAFNLKTLSAKYVYNQATIGYFNQKASSDTLMAANAGTSTTAASAVKDLVYDRKTQGFSLAYDVTPVVKLMVNRATVTIGDETNAGTDGTKTTVTGLGADYMLSKRTVAYFRTETDKDLAGVRAITGYTAATGNTTYKASAVGIRHAF